MDKRVVKALFGLFLVFNCASALNAGTAQREESKIETKTQKLKNFLSRHKYKITGAAALALAIYLKKYYGKEIAPVGSEQETTSEGAGLPVAGSNPVEAAAPGLPDNGAQDAEGSTGYLSNLSTPDKK